MRNDILKVPFLFSFLDIYLQTMLLMNFFQSQATIFVSINRPIICISKTDNIIVDALVNSKYTLAKRRGIDFIIELNIPRELPFENADLSIVLGNILDNALEANSSEGKIFLSMKYEKSILFIFLKNTYDRPINRHKDGEIVTNKADASNHGIGLKSVRKITEKYYGASIIEIDEKEFVMKISMIAPDNKNDI